MSTIRANNLLNLAGAAAPTLNGQKVHRGATLTVAASDALAASKALADYTCDGTDDQVQIQAAIDALPANVGGCVILTEGNFSVSASITMHRDNVTLEGQGMASVIKAAAGSEAIEMILMGNGTDAIANARLANFKLSSVNQKTAGTAIKISKHFKVWLDNVFCEWQYRTIYIINSTQVWITNCPLRNQKENGITIENDYMAGFDWYIANVVMDNPDVVGGNNGVGILWLGGETLKITGCDVIRFRKAMEINPQAGKECRWGFIEGAILDTSSDTGLHVTNTSTGNAVGITFVNCWTSTNTNYGILIDKPGGGTVQGIRIIGHKAMNNGLAGVRFGGGKDLSISDSDIVSNSTTVSGSRSGVEIACSEVAVLNCRLTNGYGHGSPQDWGIRVDNAAIDYYRIIGNDMRGNIQAAGLIDEGTGTNKVVEHNLPLPA